MIRPVPNLTLNFIKAAVAFFSRAGRAHVLSRPQTGAHHGLCWVLLPYGNFPAQRLTRSNGRSKSLLKNSSSSMAGILCL